MRQFAYLLTVLLFSTRLVSYGQGKLSVAITAAPTYTNTTYFNRSFYPESDGQLVEPIQINGVRGTAGFLAGVTVHYNWVPAWSVSSGIWYDQHTPRQQRIPMAGEGMNNMRQRAIRIPLLLNFRSSDKRLSPYFSFGWLVDLPLTARVLVDRPDQGTQRLRLLTDKGPVFHVVAGAGVHYKLTPRYGLIVQPTASYNLGSFGGYASHNDSYALGLQTQLVYSF
ncbi:PorT family protein [Spirosoma pomorum]